MGKITWENKNTGDQVTAAEMNQIKTAVNDNDSRILSSTIRVTQENVGTTLGGAIDSTKVYIIDGIIDMGSNSIEVPIGGINIVGSTFDVSQLVSLESAYTMFVSPVGGSGNVLISDVGISTVGIGSSVFGLEDSDGTHAIEMSRVNFNGCSSLGYMDGYRQGLEDGTGRFGGTPELEFRNNWTGGYRISTSIVRGLSNISALFSAGTGFNYDGRFIFSINCDLPTTGAFLDFAPSNININESLELEGCRITRDGVSDASDSGITPNISESSVKSIWDSNVGVPNTIKSIRGVVTSEVNTSIPAADTYVPLEGTMTITDSSHFQMPANGEFELLSGNGKYQFSGDLVIDGGSNDELQIRVTKSEDGGTTWPTEIFTIRRQVNSLIGARDVAFFPVNFIAVLVATNRVRIEIKNLSDGTDVTQELDSYFIIVQA